MGWMDRILGGVNNKNYDAYLMVVRRDSARPIDFGI